MPHTTTTTTAAAPRTGGQLPAPPADDFRDDDAAPAATPGGHAGPPLHQPDLFAETRAAAWPVTATEVARATADLDPAQREQLRWFHGWAVAQGLGLRAAAEKAGVDHTVLFRVYKGTYQVDGRAVTPARLLASIRSLKREDERRTGLLRADFVPTPTAKKIWWALDTARASRRLVCVVGRSQTGKTSAALAYQRKHGAGVVRYVRVSAQGTFAELWRDLAFACSVSRDGATTRIKERVLGAIDQYTLLIVDEVHLLTYAYTRRRKFDTIELLREVHDKTGCAMALVATNVFRDSLEGGDSKEKLEQVAWRGLYPVQLPDHPTDEDLAAIYKSVGLPRPDGETAATFAAAARARHLTYICECLRLGARIAAAAKAPLAWPHVLEAHDTFLAASQRD